MRLRIRGSSWLRDIGKREYAVGITKGILLYGAVIYLFYGSALPALFLIPLWIIYMKQWAEDRAAAKEAEFRNQFRDCIQAISAALKAGYSAENAIRETKRDIAPMFPPDKRIMKELELMVHQIEMNRPVGQVLEEFAERAEQEDVENFVHVFTAAKKSGGDSISMIRNAVRVISEKIDTEKEIQTMLASKKLEFDIMCAVPLVIILYMKMTFGEFLDVLYGNAAGAAVMTICLILYTGAYLSGRKLIRIEV
ncbi:MAG TPA: type II secretion system F family protein [Candidatus Mediterraneibacter norfolkensis]|nr:type II secretion system F family protein [Candidatus Mediterraneibacter norfolkensis]